MEGAVMLDELDTNLHSLFQEKRDHLPAEPFLNNIVKLIERRRAWRVFVQRAALVIGIIICAWVSPYMIKGSALISGGLNVLFQAAGNFIHTPTGLAAAAAGALLLFLFKRRWISSLI
jgi:hypothetical protein